MLSTLPFHPTINRWFEDHYPGPTPVQRESWPVIVAGHNALITAPTGSGKTLTAFLWSLSQFASGDYQAGHTKVLYISPLKALNNDIQRNLLNPLKVLTADYGFPELRVQTRSGDTSQGDRQRMLRQPPDILITTPESLGLLLTTSKGRHALGQVDTLILDEIHSIVDNRRGAMLMTNVERLVDISGDFQRIALSATVAPLQPVGAYVAGFDARGRPRPIKIIDAPGDKKIQFRVRFPEAVRLAAENGKKIWEPLSNSFRELIGNNKSTLFFTNSRRLAEKITLSINMDQVEPLAYAHHGSLSRDVRNEVEHRLKEGELKAIVATNSLEMGIDIGHLDEVVMVQSPPSVAATLQRIGRAGHSVGETSVGTLFPTHAHDFLEAAVLAEAVIERDIEPQHLMRGPLDVLAQLIISICATDPWPLQDLFDLITRATPYRHLSREHFDLVVEMLAGRYSGSRIRELKSRLIYDRINATVRATRGAVLALYSSGGTIPDRGYFQLRHIDSGANLGELDEEFVWEATIGQTFTLGTQHWQIQRITHNDVLVRPAGPNATAPPFWRSEFFNRSFHFSNRITQYLEMAEGKLAAGQSDALHASLCSIASFEDTAATELVDYLGRQRAHTQTELPHRHHLLLELVKTGPAGYKGPDDPQQLVIHTFWGGRLNQPWCLALQAAWQEQYRTNLEIHADNNAIVLQCKGEIDPHQLLTLVTPERLPGLLRASLEQSGFFGARFRECAGRSLLLNKARFNQRLPLWMSRLQAKKLLTQVKKLSQFPVVLETWRTCLDDEFDLPALMARLGEIGDGTMTWSFVKTTSPSPFAHNLTFGQVSRYMYADDTPEDDALSVLSEDLISHALHNDALRPRIEQSVIDGFELKRQRRHPGYEPNSVQEWSEWLKERILIPADELPTPLDIGPEGVWVAVDQRRWLTHIELLRTLHETNLVPGNADSDYPKIPDPRDANSLAREILSFYGPLSETAIRDLLPCVPEDLLHVDEQFIHGQLIAGVDDFLWCDAENFEMLMRFQRASRRANIEPKPIEALPLFWASLHRLHGAADEPAMIYALENLRGYPASVVTWVHDLLPARVQAFNSNHWDDAFSIHGFAWQGTGREAITLAYPEELELLAQENSLPAFAEAFIDPQAKYTFSQIAASQNLSSSALNDDWWQTVWQGQLSCDSFAPLQQGHARKYVVADASQMRTSRRRLRRAPLGWSGNWYLTSTPGADDPLTILESHKERVRLLLERYGFVNRDIVNRESLPARSAGKQWRWRDAFRALRIMELAGEVTIGHFFNGLSTPQFITPRSLSVLQTNTALMDSFWIAATDPVSPCGLGLQWPALPQRRTGNYLSFENSQLALVIENHGKELTYLVPWDDPNLDRIHAVLTHLVEARRLHIQIRQINGESARLSPFVAALERLFNVTHDHKQITLEPSF